MRTSTTGSNRNTMRVGVPMLCFIAFSLIGRTLSFSISSNTNQNVRRHPSSPVGGIVGSRKNLLVGNAKFCATYLQGTWEDLESSVAPSSPTATLPTSIDSVLDPSTPTYSTTHPTLFRERHGWCPYSERVWLTLECGNISYDTIRIDNTGGGRPSYYAGQTPQMRWDDGRVQGESMDLVYELDTRYGLGLRSEDDDVRSVVKEFSTIFPRARPSSRAAYLFQYNCEPLSRGTFERTLQLTNELLGETDGNFFCGDDFTAADVAWAPFLERYRYQLPCLHDGLWPDDVFTYQNLSDWYTAMELIPAYSCRVMGDAASWRKVLNMAGFGNAGFPPEIMANMDTILQTEDRLARELTRDTGKVLWSRYREAPGREYVADTPSKEVALTLVRNRRAIVADALKQASKGSKHLMSMEQSEDVIDAALLELAEALADDNLDKEFDAKDAKNVVSDAALAMARFLDDRICVPRDMGAIPAAYLKVLANSESKE